MAGLPDGLGVLPGGGGGFDLLMNHEISGGSGAVRAHGANGAFVSRWQINAGTLAVTSGRDHHTAPADANRWNSATSAYVSGGVAYSRFCSADLAASSAYRFGELGTDARLYLNGEESGTEGRAFAHVVSGASQNQSWELPRLGKFNWENALASPFPQARTVVIGTDDTQGGQLYLYAGDKTSTGNDIERAGLTNGTLYGVRVAGLPSEQRNTPPAAGTRFDLHGFGDVSNRTGANLQVRSTNNSVTGFLRPEDGAWDPRPGHESDFYFVTTDTLTSGGGRSRLYRLRFDDITDPLSGGEITALLEGDEGQEMLDNMAIDRHGRILMQEDPGTNARLSKIWLYDIDSAGLLEVAAHNPAFFSLGNATYLTSNEESTGIVDAADVLGDGWFLMNTMAHYSLPGELVEGGQLMAMYVDPSLIPEPAAGLTLAAAGLTVIRRSRRR
jgi:hypothetical protein